VHTRTEPDKPEEKMNITYRNIIRVVAVLALAATSASSFAQDGYRRAYEDGYGDRDGRYGSGRLTIEDAEYGLRGASCDARWGVRRELRSTGVVVAHNDLCGDPAYGVQKRLRIIYRCGDSEPMRAFAREGETLRLRCRH
jgi:hypothetical protein